MSISFDFGADELYVNALRNLCHMAGTSVGGYILTVTPKPSGDASFTRPELIVPAGDYEIVDVRMSEHPSCLHPDERDLGVWCAVLHPWDETANQPNRSVEVLADVWEHDFFVL